MTDATETLSPEELTEILSTPSPAIMAVTGCEAAAGAALTYAKAPNELCAKFFDHIATHAILGARDQACSLYFDGPTIATAEAARNREMIDFVFDPANVPEGYDHKRLHTETVKRIGQEIADLVDSAVKRQALGAEFVSRAAVFDVSEGMATLIRGLVNLTNEDEYVYIRDEDQAAADEDDEEVDSE